MRQQGCDTGGRPGPVLVTGGAGFLGINLIRLLLARGCAVVSYDLAPFDYPERGQVTHVVGDVRDAEAVTRAMSGCRQVVHAAAALPRYSRHDIFSTDVDGTRNVLQAAQQGGIERVVMISSTAVYGVPDHHRILETDPLVGVGPYGEAKIHAERLCEWFRTLGVCVPILRPKSFIGPERLGVFALLYDWAADGHNFPILGAGTNRYQLLDVEDLCEACWACLTGPRAAVNDVFNIGAADFTTLREDFQEVLDAAGFGKRIVSLPAGPAIALLSVLDRLRLSPLYPWVYATVTTDSYVAIDKAARVLGFRPRFSNRQALVRNYHWYLAHCADFAHQTGSSHRTPWSQGILRWAKWAF